MRLQKNKVFLTVIFFVCGIGAGCFCGNPAYVTGNDENLVYNFKDSKKEGTVTFTKKWKDRKLNDNRPVPDIEISTAKPRKDVRGYTVTFHSNGLKFADGSTENEMIFNSSKDIVSGQYKMPKGSYVLWYTEPECVNQVKVSSSGIPSVKIDKDIDLYAKSATFVLKQGPDVNKLIPDDVTSVIFTDEEMPDGVSGINMDADGDGGVVGWIDNQCLKISTQVDGIKITFNTSAQDMFSLKKNLTNIQFNNIDTANTTSMAYMFRGCKNLTNIDLSMFVTKQVEAMSGMFAECNTFTSIDLSSFDTSNVKYMNSMFRNCINVTEINVSSFNTAKVINMGDMFNYCSKLESLDLSNFDTSNVTSMGYMLFHCSVLKNLDISNFKTPKVTSFVGMFAEDGNLLSIDVSGFDTSNTTNFGMMFYGCKRLTSLNVNNFVTSKAADMGIMFGGCSGLTSIDVSSFDTSNVKNMSRMFEGCGFEAIDVSNFNTSNVTNMQQMFYGCQKLKSLDLSNFNTHCVTNICNMFNLCYVLTSLDISSFDTTNVTNMNWTFSNLNKLKTLSLGEKFAFVGTVYGLAGTWANSAGDEFDSMAMPNNVADTYTRVS